MIEHCRRTLGLSKLTQSPAVSDEQAVQCCRKLLDLTAQSRRGTGSSLVELLAGQWLCLDSYYTVTADGRIKIPSDFVLS